MSASLHTVAEACNGCFACGQVCPNKVLRLVDGKVNTDPMRAARCLQCAACVMVCPKGALALEGLHESGLLTLGAHGFGYDQLLSFLRGRRSVRLFKEAPVPREVLEQVLEAASTAPMGFPPHSTAVLVVDQKAELDRLFEAVRGGYEGMLKAYRNPIARQVLRLSAGAEAFHSIRTHVAEIVADANARFRETGEDRYTYRAPAVMLFHANRRDVAYRTNAVIVATYAMLAAQALGLGTTLIDLVAPIVNRDAGLKRHWAIPDENEVVATLILGYPKLRYLRGIRRRLKDVRYAGQGA